MHLAAPCGGLNGDQAATIHPCLDGFEARLGDRVRRARQHGDVRERPLGRPGAPRAAAPPRSRRRREQQRRDLTQQRCPRRSRKSDIQVAEQRNRPAGAAPLAPASGRRAGEGPCDRVAAFGRIRRQVADRRTSGSTRRGESREWLQLDRSAATAGRVRTSRAVAARATTACTRTACTSPGDACSAASSATGPESAGARALRSFDSTSVVRHGRAGGRPAACRRR